MNRKPSRKTLSSGQVSNRSHFMSQVQGTHRLWFDHFYLFTCTAVMAHKTKPYPIAESVPHKNTKLCQFFFRCMSCLHLTPAKVLLWILQENDETAWKEWNIWVKVCSTMWMLYSKELARGEREGFCDFSQYLRLWWLKSCFIYHLHVH